MSTDFKIIMAALAVLVWLVSWFVRRKNRNIGIVLSWVAVVLALATVLLVWLTKKV